jgi:serine/threonine protein kinase
LLERRGVRLLPHTIYDLLADCLEGLVCAHGAGLVHGNLKPQNLLLGSEHEPYAIKLTDFQPKGLWCLTARADGATSDYDQAALPFRPPTQVQNPSAITPEHDVWSLAAIGCLLFTGHAPREPLRDAPGNDASVAERGVPIRQRYRVLPAGADMLFDLIDQTLAGQITSAAEMQQALLRTARPPGLTCG